MHVASSRITEGVRRQNPGQHADGAARIARVEHIARLNKSPKTTPGNLQLHTCRGTRDFPDVGAQTAQACNR